MSKPVNHSDYNSENNTFTQTTASRNEQRKSDSGKTPPARRKASKLNKSDVRKDK